MLYTDIRKLQKLDAKRSPMFDKNRFAKFLMYFAVAFWAAYLIFFGVMLSFAFEEDSPNMEPYHVLNQGLIIFKFEGSSRHIDNVVNRKLNIEFWFGTC